MNLKELELEFNEIIRESQIQSRNDPDSIIHDLDQTLDEINGLLDDLELMQYM